MNSTEKLLKCIVCLKTIGIELKNICPKGHIHCQECFTSLDGSCGLCDLPMKPMDPSVEENEVVASTSVIKVQPINDDGAEAESAQIDTKGKSKMKFIESVEKVTKTEPSSDEQISKKVLDNLSLSDELSVKPMEQISASVIGTALYETLKALHRSICHRKCKSFDRCIHKVLLRIIDENTFSTETTPDPSIKGTESLTDLLETLHVKLCARNCDTLEYCLNQQLGKLIQDYKMKSEHFQAINESDALEAAEEGSKTLDDEQYTEKYIASNSNVVRATYNRGWVGARPEVPQFEILTELPKSFETEAHTASSDKAFLDDLDNLKAVQDLEQLECPMPGCIATIDILKTVEHLEQSHKSLTVQHISVGICKTFYIDPSILEPHETDCLKCYFVSYMLDTKKTGVGLPIFLLACRTSLRKLFSMPNEFDSQGHLSTESSQTTDYQAEAIDAAIDEAIYGTNTKVKRTPVIWSSDDVLVVWPVAPITQYAPVKTVLTVFEANNPLCHRTISFLMRSMQHSRELLDVFSAPDALTLTSVEVDALTNHGQHAIQCQIMCNF